MKKNLYIKIYPFLFVIFPILSLYSYNIDQSLFADLVPLIAGAIILTAIFLFIAFLFTKNLNKSSLVVSVLIFLFFTYGHIHTYLLQSFTDKYLHRADFKLLDLFAKSDIHIHYPLLAIYILVFVLFFLYIILSKNNFINLSKILTAVSIFLLIWPISTILQYRIMSNKCVRDDVIGAAFSNERTTNSVKRDIYYIVLDAYGRQDILSEFYGFDNYDFIKFLNKKGFYIASDSHSNYAWTFLSLSSSLNFKYINDFSKKVGEKSKDLRIPYQLIKKNKVAEFLKKRGYKFVHFNSTWGATLSNRYCYSVRPWPSIP